MKVLKGSNPNGSIIVTCSNPNCNAVISVAPHEWNLSMGTLRIICPLLWMGHRTSLKKQLSLVEL